MIGLENERRAAVGVLETNSPEGLGIMTMTEVAFQRNRLIANDSGRAIDWSRIEPSGVDIRLGSGD